MNISAAFRDHPRPRAMYSAQISRSVRAAQLAGLRTGNPQCYEELVRDQTGRLLRVALRFLDEEDARDVVQETFVCAFERIGTFREEASIGTWLYRIAVNRCLQRLRKASTSREVSLDTLLPDYAENDSFAEPQYAWPDGILERLEQNRCIRRCLERLPVHYRTVLILRDLEGMNGEEAATLLGINDALVKVRLHRARRAMRTLLSESVIEISDAEQ